MVSSEQRAAAYREVFGLYRLSPTNEEETGAQSPSSPRMRFGQCPPYPPCKPHYPPPQLQEQHPQVPSSDGQVTPGLEPSSSSRSRSIPSLLLPPNTSNLDPSAPWRSAESVRTLSARKDEDSIGGRGHTRRVSVNSILGGTTITSRKSTSTVREPSRPWVQLVPKEGLDGVNEQERLRQGTINYLIKSQCDFVRDVENLRDDWVQPFQTRDRCIIPWGFVQQVFRNVQDILDVSIRFRNKLIERQKASPVIETIGDIFLEFVPHFDPFVQYSKQLTYGKYACEKEKSANLAFAAFMETIEILPESLRLELNAHLTHPITHLTEYLPLLRAVLHDTSKDCLDQTSIPKAIKMIHEVSTRVDEVRGMAENLVQLEKRLIFRPGEEMDLRLWADHRRLVYQGRGGTADNNDDVQILLLDHVLLIAKSNVVEKNERLEVFKAPIPLGLLMISRPSEDAEKAAKLHTRFRDRVTRNTTPPPLASRESGRQLTVSYLGRRGYDTTLWAPNVAAREEWEENIIAQQEAIRERNTKFDTFTLSDRISLGDIKVNCVATYDSGRRLAYGTDNGVYFQSLYDDQIGTPIRKVPVTNVLQLEILEDYQLLIVLAERQALTFPLEAMNTDDPIKYMKRIDSNVSFFKTGHCLDRTLVCIVKVDQLSSMIKVLEPTKQSTYRNSTATVKKLSPGWNDTLEASKEFFIPKQAHSICFLKTKLCVICTTGFEMVDLKTLNTHSLLDQTDISFDFVRYWDDVRPLGLYPVKRELLLCYTKFAFFVNRSGERSRNDAVIYWEGTPTAFALHYPYVMAIDPTFIEIRNIENGALVQVIHGSNLRLLFADARLSLTNSINSVASVAKVQDEIILASDDGVMEIRLVKPLYPRDTSTTKALNYDTIRPVLISSS